MCSLPPLSLSRALSLSCGFDSARGCSSNPRLLPLRRVHSAGTGPGLPACQPCPRPALREMEGREEGCVRTRSDVTAVDSPRGHECVTATSAGSSCEPFEKCLGKENADMVGSPSGLRPSQPPGRLTPPAPDGAWGLGAGLPHPSFQPRLAIPGERLGARHPSPH